MQLSLTIINPNDFINKQNSGIQQIEINMTCESFQYILSLWAEGLIGLYFLENYGDIIVTANQWSLL